MAELVLMAAARELVGKAVSQAEAATYIESWFQKQLPEMKAESFHLENGSGLSSRFRCSPLQEVKVLEFTDRFLIHEPTFQSFMPISGWKGTLAERFSDDGLDFRIWAKTGSLSYVVSLAGYLQSQSGKRLMFSIMSLQKGERERIEQIFQPLDRSETQKISHWRQKAYRFQNELILKWVRKY
jgi:D-alanyl-D-alanine carboxypeptidase/D-alanyl-D-alanine-endopeptidase (penicillin-binding protein 4)